MDDTKLSDAVDMLEVRMPCRGTLRGMWIAHVNPMNFKKTKVLHWVDAIPYINADWVMNGLRTAIQRVWEYQLALSSCSPGSQLYPELHKRKCV